VNARRIGRLVGALAAIAATLVGASASPAAADPARPSDYESRIDAITPEVDAISVRIIGGDAFIELTAEPGTEVTVLGYEGEPYLQFLPDGTVQENTRSAATYLNESRYARPDEVDVPTDISPEDEPVWRTVATGGTYAWHDHRVHWMSPDQPPGVEPGDIIQTQDVELIVDGEPVAITVSVILAEPVSPLPWLALALLAAVGLSALGWRRGALVVATAAAALAAVLAVVAGQAELSEVPAGAGGTPLVVIVPAIGLATAGLAGLLLWRGARGIAGVSLLASAACLGGWGLLRITVLFKPVLPTGLSPGVDRAATALAIGVAAAVAVLVFHSGAVTPAPIADEDEPVGAPAGEPAT
jgi:hypothetical protein